MKVAINEACLGVAKGDGGPFGAVVVRDGEILSYGHNMVCFTSQVFLTLIDSLRWLPQMIRQHTLK